MSETSARWRPVAPGDLAFLRRLHASTRAEEFAVANWSPEDLTSFLDEQFARQQAAYRSAYPGSDVQIVMIDGAPAGAITIHRTSAHLRLVDIALLPEWRGKGHGTRRLQALLNEAMQTSRPVLAQVDILNRAQRLYERLGFVTTGESGIHREIEWRSSQPKTAS